ncbi:MAG: phosphatase PAP2 family protein [Thermoleophilaceae bacterium]
MLRALDLVILRALRTHGHSPRVERAVLAFTRTGEHGLLWQALCLAGALADRRRRPRYVGAMRTIMGAYLVNIALKHVVRRRRPIVEALPALSTTITALSYPSAHSTTSFAAARALTRHSGVPWLPIYAGAVAMGLSRVYVGVHYPSDVLAGAVLGTALVEAVERAPEAIAPPPRRGGRLARRRRGAGRRVVRGSARRRRPWSR